ncbi:MAG: HupE/UreJ family protein [Pseudomonadales bacterium]
MNYRRYLFYVVPLIWLFSSYCGADPQSKSFSSWKFEGDSAQLSYSIESREVTRLPGYQFNASTNQVLADHLSTTIALTNGQERCTASPPVSRPSKPGHERLNIQFQCRQTITEAKIQLNSLFDYASSHVHFARIELQDQPDQEFLFTPRHTQQTISIGNETQIQENPGSSIDIFMTYTWLGFEHILIGFDHIAFLLALLLIAPSIRHVLYIVTGFTLGHSITLSLAALEIATPNTMLVEALIGFTIALVAVENIATRYGSSKPAAWLCSGFFALLLILSALGLEGPGLLSLAGLSLFCLCYLMLSDSEQKALQLRPVLTVLFGLIHGFGFANVLLEVGLPQNSLLPALFGFNIGVEIGQIVIVLSLACAALLAVKLLPKLGHAISRDMLSASLCGLGMFWFIQRSFY